MLLAIYGTGGMGKEVYDFAYNLKLWDSFVFINDYIEECEFRSWPCMPYTVFRGRFASAECEFVIAQGEPEAKRKLFERLKADGYKLANLIGSHSYIAPSAEVGEGIIIYGNNSISADVKIGDNVTINPYVIIGHDAQIESHCQIGCFSFIGGHAKVGEGSYLGVQCAVKDRIKIGHDSILSMGAVVVRDVPEESVVMGNPARVIDKNTEHKVFKQ